MPQGQTLAQMVRAKYPGAYDDLDDAALESAITKKFPGVYDDLPKTSGTPKPTATDSAASSSILGTLGDVAIGAAKSLPAIVEAGGNLIRSIPGVRQLEEATGAYVDTGLNTKPTNTAQAVGRVAGDVATAFVPGGQVTRAARAAAAMAPRGTAMLARGAVEGAGAAGIAAAQGNDPTVAGAIAAPLGAVSQAAAGAAARLKKGAEASMISALGPAGRGTGPVGTNQLEMGKKLAPELLKRGFKATSHQDALVKIGASIEKADEGIDAAMRSIAPAGTTVKLKTGPIIASLAKAKEAGQVAGVDVGTGKIANRVIDDVIEDLRAIGPNMTPEQAVKFRQKIGPLAKFSQLASNTENVQADAYKDVYNGVRSAIENLSPDIRTANKEMSFWINVRDLVERASKRPQAPSSGTSGAILGGMAGTSMGTATAGKTLFLAAVGRQLQRLVRSPGWRFMAANVKDDLADAIVKGDLGRFNQLVAAAASSGVSQ